MRPKLEQQLAKHGEPLWVISPLTRAIQTFMEACPVAVLARLFPPELVNAASGSRVGSGVCEDKGLTSSGVSSLSSPWQRQLHIGADPSSGYAGDTALNIELLPAIAEYVVTAGDIGRPPSHLAQEFPQVPCLFCMP